MRDVQLLLGDCIERLRELPDTSVDSVVTDPPYGLSKEPDIAEVMRHWINGDRYEHKASGFMGNSWDSFVPGPEYWREVFRVLRPGGHTAVFAGTRTQDLMTIALRFAGFEIRDTLSWLYGSGFPKSLNLKGEYAGWGTALKPAHEPIILARKPLKGTVAANVQTHGTGALNIDACRVPSDGSHMVSGVVTKRTTVTGDERTTTAAGMYGAGSSFVPTNSPLGRWPSNLLLSHSATCDGVCADYCPVAALDRQSGQLKSGFMKADTERSTDGGYMQGFPKDRVGAHDTYGDHGGASRFFPQLNFDPDYDVPFLYCAKASRKDRGIGNTHATVKPTALMRWLIKLVTPPSGVVLDPFMGSGTTGVAAKAEGFSFIGIEREPEYFAICESRIGASNDAARPNTPADITAPAPSLPTPSAQLSLLDAA